jgi:choline-sulfatase
VPEGLIENLPTNYKALRAGFGNDRADPRVEQKGRDLYWALTDWLDDEIGKLLTCLDASAAADNTVVIYTSDHGENKGDHGLWWKNNMFEHASRVPLIVRWPRRWAGGQRRKGACSLVDLVQTIAGLAGAQAPADWDGESMLAWMDDPAAGWRDLAVSEYYGHNICSGFAMIRRRQWKYVYHCRIDERHGPERELYDLSRDPKEFDNLARPAGGQVRAEHAELMDRLHRELVAELGREPDEAEAECRADYARGYGRDESAKTS